MRLSVSRLTAALLRRTAPGSAAPASNTSPARRRARLAVLLFLPAFLLVLAAAWAAAESAVPEITDTDYHIRLRVVRAAATAHPNQPLGIVLGSSRTVWAFQPEQLTESSGDVYWVNASHIGSGPALNRLWLHRLLRDGVRPAVVAVEVMPTFFVKENTRFVSGHFAAADLSLVRPYSDDGYGYDYYFLRHRVTRIADLARVTDPYAGWAEPLPRGGLRALEDDVTPAERAKRTAAAHTANSPQLQSMAVRPGADRALRDTLRQAAEHGVRAVLLRMPEGPTFRGWYDPAALARFDRYVASVAADHGVPVVDARLWLEENDFYDSHHVLRRGAIQFTARFARDLPSALAAR